MNWDTVTPSFVDELRKIAEARKKPVSEKVIDTGAPILAGAGLGKTLSDLSWSKDYGASPRRKTIGTLIGAAAGLGYHAHKQKQKARKKAGRMEKKAQDPFKFPSSGSATPRFLGKPGKSIPDITPKIGRIGTLPKLG